jgi:hypothetical protein
MRRKIKTLTIIASILLLFQVIAYLGSINILAMMVSVLILRRIFFWAFVYF